MNESDFLFCPFCGHNYCALEQDEFMLWIRCQSCLAQGPKEYDVKAAISSWEHRYSSPAHPKE